MIINSRLAPYKISGKKREINGMPSMFFIRLLSLNGGVGTISEPFIAQGWVNGDCYEQDI